MNRKIYYWKLAASEMQLGDRTLVMGVINLTPDSFSDGGRYNDPDLAYARALELEEAGADIIDLGAESTRPGSTRISADEEWQRLVPVLKKLKGNLRVPLSLDTYKSEIAERALQYGVEILNDPSGLTFDPGLAKVAANGNVGLILNHMRGAPESWAKMPPMKDPIGTIAKELDATISRARLAGVERGRIVIDPGLGFGKRKEQNSEIIGRLAELATALDYPILLGASRKSFLALPTEADTMFATAGAVAAAVLNGAHIVRVHDVKEMRAVTAVIDEILKAVEAGTRVPDVEEKPALKTPRSFSAEPERSKPTRAPLMKPVVVAPPAVVVSDVIVESDAPGVAAEMEAIEIEVLETAAFEAGVPETVGSEAVPTDESEKPVVAEKVDGSKPFRTPGKFSEDRDKFQEGGFRPPPRPAFRPDRPAFDKPRFDRPRTDGPPPNRDFRPGGTQGDRPRFDRPQGDRPSFNRPQGDRPSFNRPQGDRPSFNRPQGDRPSFNRPQGDRPSFNRPQGDRPSFDRPQGDRPRFDRPQGDRPRFDRPQGDRPSFNRPQGDRPSFNRPQGDRPSFNRPQGDRPSFSRPQGDRPFGDRPQGDRPREGFKPGGPPRSGDRDDRRPPFGGDRGGGRPGGFKPGGFKPGGFKPGGFKPGGFKPGGFKPGGPPSRPFRKRP